MNQVIVKTAIEFAKNKRVQRITIGLVVGGVVGYAIARTVEPLLFPEPEFEMIPPYDTPEDAIARDEIKVSIDGYVPLTLKDTKIGQVTGIRTTTEGVTITARIGQTGEAVISKPLVPKLKYAKPVHAAAVAPTVARTLAPLTGNEKLKEMIKPVVKNEQPPASSFSSTRGESLSKATGGDPRKKVNPVETGE